MRQLKRTTQFLLGALTPLLAALVSSFAHGATFPDAQSDWAKLEESSIAQRMSTASCREFKKLLVDERASEKGLKTDTLLVIKNGVIQYEFYDGTYTAAKPHCLWSASKSVTAALLGASIQAGAKSADGRPLTLERKLVEFFPGHGRDQRRANERFFEQVTLRDLVHMSANFKWSESYEADIREGMKGGVLGMLYGDGRFDVLQYALNAPMGDEGPGGKYVYSGGNSNLIMGVLRQISGANYETLPWDRLFNVLGMRKVSFEQDPAGNFIGSSYVHMTTRDMARFGYLHLRDGFWNGKRVLPKGWVQFINQISPAMKSAPMTAEFLRTEGTFGGTMWLNKAIPEKGVEKPFPNSPDDLFFSAGHYGQLILMIPSLDLLIVRTGHDAEYWSKIDKMTSSAVSCFSR